MHVITHSHLDAGWVYDVDKCYDVTKHIFSSVLEELLKDPQRTYTVGDLYYFERWFKSELNEQNKQHVRDLVRKGQIEVLHGGGVSPDEATCDADDIIDNMILSREWIKKEFDMDPPNIAWQLDIFGHGAGHAQLITELGIEMMVFARMP